MTAIVNQSIQTTSKTTDSILGSLALTNNSTFQHIITGTTSGFIISLPNISTIENGQQFQFLNESNHDIFLRDFTGNPLLTINAGLMGYASLSSTYWIARQENIDPSLMFNENVIITNHNGEVMVNSKGYVLRSN
jgi:hypothetical protein